MLRRKNCNIVDFSLEKEVIRIDRKRKEMIKTISYRLRFIDCARFMAISLSNLVNKIAEAIHKTKCKYGHNDKMCGTCGIKYKDCNCFLKYINFEDNLINTKVATAFMNT